MTRLARAVLVVAALVVCWSLAQLGWPVHETTPGHPKAAAGRARPTSAGRLPRAVESCPGAPTKVAERAALSADSLDWAHLVADPRAWEGLLSPEVLASLTRQAPLLTPRQRADHLSQSVASLQAWSKDEGGHRARVWVMVEVSLQVPGRRPVSIPAPVVVDLACHHERWLVMAMGPA
ncbi:MAG: hypothetical protein ACRD0L_04265 [Acidimicrobiales bacterium]